MGGVGPIVGVIPAVGAGVTVLVGVGVGVVRVGSAVGEMLTVGEAAIGVWLTGVDVPAPAPTGDLDDVPGVFDVTGAVAGTEVVCMTPGVDELWCLLVELDTTVATVLPL